MAEAGEVTCMIQGKRHVGEPKKWIAILAE
jgi:hypothetical protein